MACGRADSMPDPDWARSVIKLLEDQQIDQLIAEATELSCLRPAMLEASYWTGSPCSAPSATAGRPLSRRSFRTVTPTALT
jgi:ribosomal protein L12E/L44/L45/RPP1/RPP2